MARRKNVKFPEIGIERLDQLTGPLTEAVLAEAGAEAAAKVLAVKRDLEVSGPRLSGRFNASWVAFVERPPNTAPEKGRSSLVQSSAEAETVLSKWKAGESMGLVSNLLYTRRLAFHRWSKKVSAGWLQASINRGLGRTEPGGNVG